MKITSRSQTHFLTEEQLKCLSLLDDILEVCEANLEAAELALSSQVLLGPALPRPITQHLTDTLDGVEQCRLLVKYFEKLV